METKDCLKRLARLRVQLLVLLLVLVGVRGWGVNPTVSGMKRGNNNILSFNGAGIQSNLPQLCLSETLIIEGNDFTSATFSCACTTGVNCVPNVNSYKIQIYKQGSATATNANVVCWQTNEIEFVIPATLTKGDQYYLLVEAGNNNYSQAIFFEIPALPGAVYPSNSFCENVGNIIPTSIQVNSVFAYNPSASNNLSSLPTVGNSTGNVSAFAIAPPHNQATIGIAASYPNNINVCNYPPSQIVLTVNKPAATSITYNLLNSICQNQVPASISCSTTPSGSGSYSFSGTQSLPGLNTANGNITFGGSPSVGTYTVQYAPTGCFQPSSTSFSIITNPISFSYPSLTICKGAAPMAPNPVEPQGSFSLVSGPGFASVDANTGAFDPANSSAGVYTIRWSKPSRPCSTFAETTITVIDPGDPAFSYSGFTFCTSDAHNPTTGISSGNFFSPTLPSQYLDPLTGEIDIRNPAFSQFGPHVIINTQNGQGCTLTHQQTVNIVEDRETLNYPDFQVCNTDPVLYPIGLGSGQGSGAFQSFPAVHPSLDLLSGVISPALITAQDSFRVCWTLSGRTCRDSICTPQYIVVDTTLDASFAYVPQGSNTPQSEFCLTELPVIATASVVGGAYLLLSSSPVLLPGNGAFGNLQTVPGTYTIRHELSGACPDMYDLTIDILPTDGINFAYTNAATNNNQFCQSAEYLYPTMYAPTPSGGRFSIADSTDSKFQLNSSTGIITLDQPDVGTYYIRYTSTGDCPQIDSVALEILATPETDFSLFRYSICEGEDTLGIYPADTTGSWSVVSEDSSAVILDFNEATGIIDTDSALPGRYKVTHEINLGTCQSTTEQFFTILDYDASTHIVLDSTGIICAGDQVSFQIDGVKNGIFSVSGVSLSGSPAIGITASLAQTLSDTQFVAHYSGYGQCNEADSLTFQVRAKDATRLAFPDASACENDPLAPPSLWAPGQGVFSLSDTSYYRIDPATGSLQQTDPLVNETRISVTYRTDSICPNEASYELTYYPIPKNINLAVTQGDTSCFGTRLNLVASASGAQAFGFVLDGDTTQAISSDAFCDIDSPLVGLRELVVVAKSSRSCVNIETFYHLVHPIPYYVEGIPTDLTLVQNDQINLDISTAPNNSITYWQAHRANYEFVNPGDTGIASPNELLIDGRLVNAYSGAEILIFVQPQANGCYGDLDSVLITVQPVDVEVFIPGIITPNGDGSNDAWEIRPKSGFSTRNFIMKVFTNQGALVKRFVLNAEELTSWSAEEVPDGIYRWMLFDGEGNFYRKGALTILRTPIKSE